MRDNILVHAVHRFTNSRQSAISNRVKSQPAFGWMLIADYFSGNQ